MPENNFQHSLRELQARQNNRKSRLRRFSSAYRRAQAENLLDATISDLDAALKLAEALRQRLRDRHADADADHIV